MTAAVFVFRERYLRRYDCGREHAVSSQVYLPSNRVAASDVDAPVCAPRVQTVSAALPVVPVASHCQTEKKEKTAIEAQSACMRLVVRWLKLYGGMYRRLVWICE